MTKVILALSGGVDSSVAVHILQKQGYEVEGVTMDLGDAKTVEKARAAAADYGIKHHVWDLRADFERLVLEPFAAEYQKGRTPNPCVNCNQTIKLGLLFDRAAEALDFDYFATGHYARIVRSGERWAIGRALDPRKDQSYYLYRVRQQVLSRLLFPLGQFSKQQVRDIATELGLAAASAKDSQDICFIPDGDYRAFLKARGCVLQPGNFVDRNGKRLGQHQGIANYTVGQRKGLGIALGHPVFVTELRPDTNEVVLGLEDELLADGMLVSDCVFQAVETISAPTEVLVKLRYKSPPVAARVLPQSDGRLLVEFQKPEKSPTPGQSAVFYREDVVLGGGYIEKALGKI